jgi:anthranilate phosphoribosyltransferase
MVVHGFGGLDELTPTGENLVSEVRDGEVRTYTLDPAPLSTGPGPGSPDDLRCGGDPAQNAAVILTVFDGERGPRRDAVILNAAAALVCGGVVPELDDAIDAAVEAIDTGAALAKLEELVAFTRARAPEAA